MLGFWRKREKWDCDERLFFEGNVGWFNAFTIQSEGVELEPHSSQTCMF